METRPWTVNATVPLPALPEEYRCPMLVVQGANDRVLQFESDEIVEAVRANGVPVEYVLFPDEGLVADAPAASRRRGHLTFLENTRTSGAPSKPERPAQPSGRNSGSCLRHCNAKRA